jgi:hypothetical protein
LFQGKHGDLEAFAFFTQQILFGDVHVLQRKVTGVACANAELSVNSSRSEPFHATLNDEAGHARMIAVPLFLFIGPAEKEEVVGEIGEANPHLLTIQNVLVAFASRSRSRADNVRAGARFS